MAIGISIAAQGGPANTLTAKEKAEGWKLLFDGATLNNFVPQGKAQWKVVDGALRPEVAGGWLATKEDFTNFQLQVEFRTSAPNINSGVFLRRGRQDGDSHQIGYELQIRNPSPGDKPFDGKEGNHNAYYTGSFSGHLKSKNEPTVIMGQWHHFDVTAQGDHFIVMFDGKKVLDARHAGVQVGGDRAAAHRPGHRVPQRQDQAALKAPSALAAGKHRRIPAAGTLSLPLDISRRNRVVTMGCEYCRSAAGP